MTSHQLALLPVIDRRESRRAIDPRPLEPGILRAILEAARQAPSCANNQPWRFVTVDDPAVLARVHEGLNAGNTWAKRAPVLIAVAANPADDLISNERPYYAFDCGLAVENLLLQATEFGLVCHPMAGFKEPVVKEALGIPDEVRILVVIALGYPGNLADLDEATQAKELSPRTRKGYDEIVFMNGWPQNA